MFVHKLQLYDQAKAAGVRERLYFLLGDYRLDRKKDFTGVLDAGNFRYKVIQGSGHGVNHEQPERVHREMIDFLKKAPVLPCKP